MVEVNGTLNGKNVKFYSILGKDATIKDIASNNNNCVTTNEVPELVTSNISTTDYILSLLDKGNLTNIVQDPEKVIGVIKASKFETRLRFAAAIKAYIDYNATLNSNTVQNATLGGLIKALALKAADGEIDVNDLKSVFTSASYEKVFKAEAELKKDSLLNKVLTEGFNNVTSQEVYDWLKGKTFYWKPLPNQYDQITFNGSNGNVTISHFCYDETNNNWGGCTPIYPTPTDWLYELVFNDTTKKLYMVLKTGENFEVSPILHTNDTLIIILKRSSEIPDWNEAITTSSQTNFIYGVMACDNSSSTFSNLSDFINYYDINNCSASFNSTIGIG